MELEGGPRQPASLISRLSEEQNPYSDKVNGMNERMRSENSSKSAGRVQRSIYRRTLFPTLVSPMLPLWIKAKANGCEWVKRMQTQTMGEISMSNGKLGWTIWNPRWGFLLYPGVILTGSKSY